MPQKPAPAAPRAGRPTAARAEAIDRAILAAGRDLFFSVGFSATLMEAVAADAGVSKGTLYARYPTKEALLQAVVADRLEAWSQDARDREGVLPEDPRARLVLLACSLQRSMASDEIRALEDLLTHAPDPEGRLARAVYDSGYREGVRALREAIVHAAPTPPRDADRTAEMLLAMMIGWRRANSLVRKIGDDEAQAYAEHAVAVLLGGREAW